MEICRNQAVTRTTNLDRKQKEHIAKDKLLGMKLDEEKM